MKNLSLQNIRLLRVLLKPQISLCLEVIKYPLDSHTIRPSPRHDCCQDHLEDSSRKLYLANKFLRNLSILWQDHREWYWRKDKYNGVHVVIKSFSFTALLLCRWQWRGDVQDVQFAQREHFRPHDWTNDVTVLWVAAARTDAQKKAAVMTRVVCPSSYIRSSLLSGRKFISGWFSLTLS